MSDEQQRERLPGWEREPASDDLLSDEVRERIADLIERTRPRTERTARLLKYLRRRRGDEGDE